MAEENPWLKYIPQAAPQAAPQPAPKAAPTGASPAMERYRKHAAEVGLPMEWLDAFAGQESSGGADTRDSVQGARGPLQITKGRFLDAGGKNFDDEDDVARTAVTELNRMRLKYKDNPRAVAASWHSGPGNVNPDGTLKSDTKDALGKRTADYQTDIEKRMSGVAKTPAPAQDNPWAKYVKEYQEKNAPPSPLSLGATKVEPEGTDYTYGDAAYAGLVTGKLTLDVAANALAGFFGADQTETKRILAETLKEYSSLKKDPAMEKLVTQVKEDAASSSFGPTVGAILNLPKAVVKSDDPINLMGHFMVTQIIPSLPGFVLGAGAGAAFSRAAMQKAVTNELVKKGVSTAVAGAAGNAMAVMTSALGSNYAEGMRKFGDHQQAQDYAVRKTLAEVPANALAGSVMGMKLGPNAITNILAQAVVQGTGGAFGAAQASNAVGEEADPAELALEFWGEFASAPVEAAQAGVSAAMGPRAQAAPAEQPPAAGQPPAQPAAPAQAAPAAGMQPAPADPALPAFEVYTGNGTNVATPTGLQVGAQFGVADASSLVTAFTPTGQANPRYQLAPGANRVNQVGADPERLGASELSSEGAPVVGNDGRVESGNNRLNAIRRAYQTAQGTAYKQWLLSNLEQFGIPESSRSAIEAMEQPALIRLRVTPVDRNQFVTESNAQPAPAAPETGQAPAQATPQPAEPDSEMTYDRAIQVGKMASELGPAYGAQGTVNWTPGPLTSGTIEGLHRVRAEAQARLEEADPGATAVPDILQAAVDVATIRAQGLDVAEVLAHMEALGEEFSPEAIALIQALDEANGNPARVADLVRGLISKEQKSRTTAEIIRAQAKELRKKYGLQAEDAGGATPAGAAPEGGATEAPVDSAPELPGAREAGGQTDEAVAEEPARAAGGTQFSRSLTGKDTALTSFWTMLAQSEDLFKVPLFADKDMTKLAAKIDPAMKVFKYPVPFSKRLKANYEITMPDGKTADVMFYKDGAIVLDASRLVEGSSGGWKLYALLFNFALNNKAVFIGDPAGLSDAALFRRTENMISAALKAGTTAHMYPHERQVAEGLKWEESNRLSDDERTAVNLQNLLDFSVYLVSKTFPEINDFRYNPESGKFERVSDGSELSEEVLGRALESPGAREARIGRATLARAIVSATALREGGGEGGKPGGFGHQLLASALRQLRAGAVDPALEGSMYSRAGDTAGPVSTQDVEATIAPYRARATGLPNVVVVQSQNDRRVPADLAKLIARESAGSVAGAYHNGEIFLFADNLRDSDHAAFTFLHEAEHHGLAMLLGPEYDAVMMAIWEGNPSVQLAAGKLIRQHRLSRVDAVKEVLADWAGEGKHPTILQRLIAMIRDVMRKAGLRLKMNDADVLTLIARGKDAWKKGARRNSHLYRATEFARNPKVDKSSVDANVPRASVEIMLDPNGFKERYGLKPKRNNVREVATALERRTRERFGIISDTDTSVETAKEIAKAIAAEVKYQLANQKNSGLGWYSKNYPKALTLLGRRYPELRTSKAARGMFTAFLAITSNGERVQRNMAMAIELYEAWREGRPLAVPGAKRGDAMANAIETIEGLLRRHGPGGMQRILLEEMSVRDINAELRRRGEKTSSDYPADMLMPRAALYFGPKLGAFFANLSGSHGYLTMDLWWSRSFNRYRGLLLTTPTAGLMDRFRSIAGLADATNEDVLAAVKEPRDAYKARNYQTELELLIGRKEGKTKAEKESFMREAQTRATPAMIARHSIEKSANLIYKDAFEALNEAPFRATDREFMLNSTLMAQRLLKGDQIDITVADIQAALWYYEKQLYAALGTREAGDIGYLEAIENEANADRSERSAARVGREPARQDDDGGVAGLRGGDPEFFDIERPDASRDRRDGGGAEPSYRRGERREDSVSAVGVHYSREQRSQLLGSYYGTGLKGAEAARLQNADPRLRSRIYFYASTGQGVRPEAGVGPHAHIVRLENLYDLDADPRGLRLGRSPNDFELAILEAGFDGYIASFGAGQKGAVLLGNHSVPVAYRGMGYRGQDLQAAQSAEVAPEEQALRDFATDRRLPSGAMTPAQWRTSVQRSAPDLYTRLPASLFSGEEAGYRDQLIARYRNERRTQGSERSGDGGGRYSSGSLAPLAGAPDVRGASGPDPQLVAVAERYARENGIPLSRQAEYVEVDPDRAARIAAAYEAMPHAPRDPVVRAAYEDLIRQTRAQYDALVEAGYEFTFFDSSSDPYQGNPWNAMRDLRANKRMAVYGTYDGFGTEGITASAVDDNPMLADTGLKWKDQSGVERPVTANDLFRAVHDAFGHGLEGAGFRARGEENAWQAHVRLFTGPAVGAITSETRGQNSWLNFGPYGEKNRTAAVEDTVFAEQKTGLMPEWTWTEGVVSDQSFQDLDPTKIEALIASWADGAPSRRVHVIPALRRAIKLYQSDQDGSAWIQIQALLDRLEQKTAEGKMRDMRRERVRGLDWVKERLLRARRTGELQTTTVDFTLWALEQNPALAEDLGISIRERSDNVAGQYNPASRVITLVAGAFNTTTGVHEILHHAERMMPDEVQAGIEKGWAMAFARAMKKANEKQRKALADIFGAMAGDVGARKRVMDAFQDGTLDYDDHYQLVNPSEFWAVNATRYMEARYNAVTWVQRAKQWMREMIQKLKGLLRLPSDAPVLRGLEAVLKSDGSRQTKTMIAQRAGGRRATFEQRAYHGTRQTGIDKFSTEFIGTGEGAQAYGWGLYFASRKEIAEHYRTMLAPARETLNWRVGSIVLVKDGAYVNYAPVDRSKMSEARSVLAEYWLIYENDIKAALEKSGIDGAKAEMKKVFEEVLENREDLSVQLNTLKRAIDTNLVFETEKEQGQVYEVNVPEDDELLSWDKPLSEQPERVRAALEKIIDGLKGFKVHGAEVLQPREGTGETIYLGLASKLAKEGPTPGWTMVSADTDDRAWSGERAASEALAALGIKGIKYLDGWSRSDGEGSHNYVIFSGDEVEIANQFYDIQRALTPTKRRRSYVATSKKAIERIDRALTPLGSLPSVRKYLARRGIALGEIAQADNVGRSLYDAFAKRDAEVQQQVYEYLTTAEADPNDITDPDARREAVRAKELIDQVGQDLVGYGLLSMEAYEANRGAYLPRLYLKHLLSDKDNKAIGTGKKPSDLGYLKERKDIPKEIRDVVLGEVKDPGYLSTVGYTRATRDMALLDWLHDISLNDEWVYRKDLVEWEGHRVTAFWLKNEADRIRRQIPYYTGEVAKRANELVARMDALVNPVLDELGKVPADYRQMPNTPRYGRLRGMYVRKEIYEDIVGIGAVVSKDAGWAEKLLGYGGWATRATQFWKTMKVAMNPPGQIRNFLSNAILLQLSGVGLHKVPMRLAQAAAQIREERKIEEEGRALTPDEEERLKHWLVAKKYGLTVGTFSSQELYRAEREFLDLQARMRGPNSFMHLINIGAKVMDFAGDIYQFSEAIFKTAKIIDEMERGRNEVDAANEAQKWLFDYSLVSQSVRYLRNAPVGAPFITFAAKVAPRMLEVALHAPWRFAPWVALAYTFPMLVASMGGPDEEDQEKLKKLLPDAWKDKGHVYVLPWKDEAGRWQVLDLSYLMPWTMFTSAGKQLARGDVQEATQTMGLVGGPLPDIITAWKTGKDPFTQRDIVQKGDPLHLQLGALLTYVYNMAAPPILTDRGLVGPSLGDPAHSVGGKLPSALRGSTNRYGDPVSTLPQAAAGAVGFNVRSVDTVMDRAKKLMEKRRELDDVKARLKQALMDRALSKDERAKIVQTYLEEIKRRNQKLQEFSEATR